uniref:Uncharacterized protein n=1 Tax=Trichogramma kaykai TaxID=54128 RepID=A0ABD2WFJ5_9HYME
MIICNLRTRSLIRREMRKEYNIHSTMEPVGQSLQHRHITYIIMYTHMRLSKYNKLGTSYSTESTVYY